MAGLINVREGVLKSKRDRLRVRATLREKINQNRHAVVARPQKFQGLVAPHLSRSRLFPTPVA